MHAKTARIRALNDELRHKLTGGTVLMTPGVAALGREAVARIVKTISVFDDFCNANDPYGEHDFGAFEAEGHTIFFQNRFKILTVEETVGADGRVRRRNSPCDKYYKWLSALTLDEQLSEAHRLQTIFESFGIYITVA